MFKDYYIINGIQEPINDIMAIIQDDPLDIIEDIKDYPELMQLAVANLHKSSAPIVVEQYFNLLNDYQKREFLKNALNSNLYFILKSCLDKLKLYPDIMSDTIEVVKDIKALTEDYKENADSLIGGRENTDYYNFMIRQGNLNKYDFYCQFLIDNK